MERAENLARILDVTKSFGDVHDAGANWGQVLDLFGDRKAYLARFREIDARRVIRYYTIDRDVSNSIISSVRMAHANARTLRHLISVEMWTNINIFYNRLLALKPATSSSLASPGCVPK
ncbi:MAG: alpha-E domain-containing protein [Burkholderiaceae bacterium]